MNKLLKISIPIVLILGLLLTIGCAARQASAPFPSPEPGVPPMESTAPGIMKGSTDEDGYNNDAAIDRKIIRTGYLTLEVDDTVDAIDKVAAIADDLGGYVVSSNKNEDDDRTFGRVSIRVPAKRFNEAFDRLRQIAVDVPYESTDSRDVTEEYTDLEAQLHNLEATETQYLELLKKAETVEDILAVQRELSHVRGDIEQIKGRMQYLERTSDMSLIEISLQETMPLGTTGWNALETLKSAVHGLVVFGKALANVAIWVAIFCPIWIPILIFFTRRRRRKKAQA